MSNRHVGRRRGHAQGAFGESGSQVCRRDTGAGVGVAASARARLTRRRRDGAAAVDGGTTSAATNLVAAGGVIAGDVGGIDAGPMAAGSATGDGGERSASVFHLFAARPPASANTAAKTVSASPRAHFRPRAARLRVGPNASVAVRSSARDDRRPPRQVLAQRLAGALRLAPGRQLVREQPLHQSAERDRRHGDARLAREGLQRDLQRLHRRQTGRSGSGASARITIVRQRGRVDALVLGPDGRRGRRRWRSG